MMLTATEAAARLDCSGRTIQRLCAEHGIGRRVGRVIILTIGDCDRLAKLAHDGPGNPNFKLRGSERATGDKPPKK